VNLDFFISAPVAPGKSIILCVRGGEAYAGVPRDHWNDGDLSFPSGHTAAAFAIGTVFAESGDDRQRA
jgi:membrane-associated phospholipid phosphatase